MKLLRGSSIGSIDHARETWESRVRNEGTGLISGQIFSATPVLDQNSAEPQASFVSSTLTDYRLHIRGLTLR